MFDVNAGTFMFTFEYHEKGIRRNIVSFIVVVGDRDMLRTSPEVCNAPERCAGA